jgi:hypothetical protein
MEIVSHSDGVVANVASSPVLSKPFQKALNQPYKGYCQPQKFESTVFCHSAKFCQEMYPPSGVVRRVGAGCPCMSLVIAS